ncbi:Histone-lysine N-methyltransferase smyd1 [Branchiostoma belcheri]|nr:Histone-lysine N-methyltransferase smyd1 [Branchiostoma belcheri]
MSEDELDRGADSIVSRDGRMPTTLVLLSAAANESCSPECRWVSCSDGRLQFSGSWFNTRNIKHPCLTCSKEPGPLPDASCFSDPKWVGVRGVPFGVLSAAKLPIPERTQLAFLALVDTEITDLEQNTLANLSTLQELHMEFNNLTEHTLRLVDVSRNSLVQACLSPELFYGFDNNQLRSLLIVKLSNTHSVNTDITKQWSLSLRISSHMRQISAVIENSILCLRQGHDNDYQLQWNEKKSKDDILGANSLCSALDSLETRPKSAVLVSPFVIVLAKAGASAKEQCVSAWKQEKGIKLPLKDSLNIRLVTADIQTCRNRTRANTALIFDEKSTETENSSNILEGNQGEPTESMEMKNINARGRASSSPVVALQDNIFDRLQRSTHLKRQYSVPSNPANKNGRRSAHDTSFDAPHYWEIPDSLVDSTQQPAPGELDAPNYWEIPDALVDSVPNSDEISGAPANSTRDPVTDEAGYSEIPDAHTIGSQRRPSSLPIDTFLCTRTVPDNTAPRPASLPHQYWHITDEDIGGDSVTFYASAAETNFSVVTKSENNNRLYETETTQEGDGHSIPATYGADSAQTASVVLNPED